MCLSVVAVVFSNIKKNEKVPNFQVPHWKTIWLNIIVKQAPRSLVSRAWAYPCLAAVLLRDLNKSLLPLPELLRSLLPRTANPCMKAALGDHCFIVTHPARTLLDIKTTLSRSRNSTRSDVLACLNWLKLLNFSGNSLICTSRKIGVHSVFFSKGVWGECKFKSAD